MIHGKKIILISLFIFQLTFAFSGDITGDVINGKAVSSPVTFSIAVVASAPSISISSPLNETYLTNESLSLTYSVANEDTVWYNLDGGSNITLTNSILFNVSQGGHSLYIYANDSSGNLAKTNVTFTANSSKFRVLYGEYNGSTKGDSTNFIYKTFEGLQNMTGIILENSSAGKIVFNEYINATNDLDFTDGILNLDSNSEISSNLVSLNSSALPNFNVSATISLYGLSFSDPQVLVEGNVCPTEICSEVSYSGGIFIFNVTHFSEYSARETPISSTIPPGIGSSGRGGGGGPTIENALFLINKKNLDASLFRGEMTTLNLTLTNKGKKKILIKATTEGFENFIFLKTNEIIIEAGKSKIFYFDVIAKENQTENIYLNRLIFKSGKYSSEVKISLEIESFQKIFDVDLKITEDFLEIFRGGELSSEIKLFNFNESKLNLTIEYFIKNSDGKTIFQEKEIKMIETNFSFFKSFYLPKNLEFGDYILYVKVSLEGKVASASEWFSVVEEPSYPLSYGNYKLVWTIILLILILIFVIFFISGKRKGKASKTKKCRNKKS